jgi:hypothetical protein
MPVNSLQMLWNVSEQSKFPKQFADRAEGLVSFVRLPGLVFSSGWY